MDDVEIQCVPLLLTHGDEQYAVVGLAKPTNMIIHQIRDAVATELRDLSGQTVIAIGGISTAILTVVANYLLTQWLNINFLSLTVWFVVPAGGLIGGMGAAAGYYFAARWTQTMPNRTMMLNMIIIGACTWFLAEWVDYRMLTFSDGVKASDVASFWNYFTFHTEHMQLDIRMRSGVSAATTGELGSLGYVREALQLLGFIAGGLATFLFLGELEVCTNCRKYARTTTLLSGVTAPQFGAMLDRVHMTLPGVTDRVQSAISGKRFHGMQLVLAQCPKCSTGWVIPGVLVSTNRRDVNTVVVGRYALNNEAVVRLRDAVGKQQ